MRRWSLLVLLLLGSGCSSTLSTDLQDPAAVADAFVRAYYVDTDLQEALQYCGGLACKMIRDEVVLREGQVITADTRRPKIRMERKPVSQSSETPEGLKRFFYRLTIQPPDSETFFRQVYVKVRQREGEWRVTQFMDQEAPAE